MYLFCCYTKIIFSNKKTSTILSQRLFSISLISFVFFKEISRDFFFFLLLPNYSVFACRECCIIFEDRKSLTQHQWIYNHRKVDTERLSEENRCRRERELKIKLMKQKKAKEAINRIYICNYNGCNKIFTSYGIYNRHCQTHIKKYRCSYMKCNREFSTKHDLMIHDRTHSKVKSETCKFCLRCFTDPAALRKHIKYIHKNDGLINGINIKQFHCKHCKKSFDRKDSLKKHLQIHLKDNQESKSFCEICHLSFTFKWNYTKHNKIYHH